MNISQYTKDSWVKRQNLSSWLDCWAAEPTPVTTNSTFLANLGKISPHLSSSLLIRFSSLLPTAGPIPNWHSAKGWKELTRKKRKKRAFQAIGKAEAKAETERSCHVEEQGHISDIIQAASSMATRRPHLLHPQWYTSGTWMCGE